MFASAVLLCALLPASALAVTAPHVPTNVDTDACAMCHRGHSSASGITARGSDGESFTALTVGSYTGVAGDTELCFSCHGYGSLGSTLDIQSEFASGVGHSLAPSVSPYGPSPKQCADCHDSHGSDRDASGTPYAALLRARTTTSAVFAGNGYCVVCHPNRTTDTWDGQVVFEKTAHAEITATASGTRIICSACHAPHGSANRPLIVTKLETPSALAAAVVTSQGRSLCAGCHGGPLVSYPGTSTFQASAHGSSATTVTVRGEWVSRLASGSAEASRAVGECQNCHNPMGADDGTGKPIAKLAVAAGSGLCYRCHGTGSTITTPVASVVSSPTGSIMEFIAGYSLADAAAPFGRMQLYTRESTATTALVGPRQYLAERVGPSASGDIDGDGQTEIVVARTGGATATVFSRSLLRGIEPIPGDRALLASATALVIGDVIDDVNNLPELIAGNGSTVLFYRWNGATFSPLAASVTVTGTITDLGAGQISGTTRDEIVVTENLPGNGADEVTVISASSGTPTITATYNTRNAAEPTGPSVGDLDGDGLGEIAVANSGAPPGPPVSVYEGGVRRDFGAISPTALARDTAIDDLFFGNPPAAGRTGAEVIVTMSDAGGDSHVDVYEQDATGALVSPPSTHTFANGTGACGLATGDLDGDGRLEIGVVGSGYAAGPVAPRAWVVDTNAGGTALGSATELLAAGAESADAVPRRTWALIAEMGPVGTSRHAVGAVTNAHVSTESVGFTPRHVECMDCHNSHAATSTPAAAPNAYGEILGTWGVSVSNAPVGFISYTEKRGVTREYELCLKCHGGWAAAGTTRDIAAEIDTRNASFHPVEALSSASEATTGSFEAGWSNASRVYCVDCHGRSSASGPRGPHASLAAPILARPYWGTASSDTQLVCYRCHSINVYSTGTSDGVPASTSQFYDADLPGNTRDALHAWHTLSRGLSCDACHVSHGAPREHMIRADLNFVHTATGGSCEVVCHAAGTNTYSRP